MVERPYTVPGIGWLLAVLGVILTIVWWATGHLSVEIAVLFLLGFLALLL